jgi:hypothetical protein
MPDDGVTQPTGNGRHDRLSHRYQWTSGNRTQVIETVRRHRQHSAVSAVGPVPTDVYTWFRYSRWWFCWLRDGDW